MYKFESQPAGIPCEMEYVAQHSPRFLFERNTEYVSQNFKGALLNFLTESSSIIKQARQEMRSRHPNLLS